MKLLHRHRVSSPQSPDPGLRQPVTPKPVMTRGGLQQFQEPQARGLVRRSEEEEKEEKEEEVEPMEEETKLKASRPRALPFPSAPVAEPVIAEMKEQAEMKEVEELKKEKNHAEKIEEKIDDDGENGCSLLSLTIWEIYEAESSLLVSPFNGLVSSINERAHPIPEYGMGWLRGEPHLQAAGVNMRAEPQSSAGPLQPQRAALSASAAAEAVAPPPDAEGTAYAGGR